MIGGYLIEPFLVRGLSDSSRGRVRGSGRRGALLGRGRGCLGEVTLVLVRLVVESSSGGLLLDVH